jgi:hypothetical protein
MSNHLVQTFENEAVKYCYKHGASTPPWRSVSIIGAGSLTGAEDDDSWQSAGDGIYGGIFIRYGTCCLWKATVRFTLTADIAVYEGSVLLNGDFVGGFSQSGSAGARVSAVSRRELTFSRLFGPARCVRKQAQV